MKFRHRLVSVNILERNLNDQREIILFNCQNYRTNRVESNFKLEIVLRIDENIFTEVTKFHLRVKFPDLSLKAEYL